MKRLFVFFVLLVLSLGFAAQCRPGFAENIYVQVLDAKMRPVENAKVSFTYQVSYSTGKGYFTTPYFYTDKEGKTSYLVINEEQLAERVDCNIVIRAAYGSASAQKTIIAENHENLVQLKLDIYDLAIIVVDQNGKPLSGAEVWVENVSRVTDVDGLAFFKVKPGINVVYVKYADGKIEHEVVVNNDTIEKVGVGLYPLTISVRDDNGNYLNAIAMIGNNTYTVNGTLTIEKLATARPLVVVRYKNVEKEIDVDLTIKNEYSVFFDNTNPVITNVSDPEFRGDVIKLTIYANDPGQFASGIAPNGVELKYDVNKSKQWAKASVYQKAKGVFIAEIPTQPPESRIDFALTVKDKEGNWASMDGWFLVPTEQQEKQAENATEPVPPSPSNQSDQESRFPWLLAIIALIVIIAIAFVYLKMKGGGDKA
jgi:hypothetical protein